MHLSGANEELERFARALNMPVAHTMTGKGAIACTDPLSAGVFGRYDRIANGLIENADVILVVGCKLGEIATKRYSVPPRGKTLIHLDSCAEEFDRTVTPALRLWGDAREGLRDLAAALAAQAAAIHARQADYAASVRAAMDKWRSEVAPRLTSDEVPVSMARLLNEINRVLPADGYPGRRRRLRRALGRAAVRHQARRPHRFVPDRGFASIGYGLPGAMGVALAAPGKKVLSLTGDGGFNMMVGELETARRMALDFTVIVVNNAASGYVKALQHLMYGAGAYQSSDLAETDYARVARGVRLHRHPRREARRAAPARSNARWPRRGPVVLDVVVTRDPAKMLPGVDNRTAQAKKGDRVA